jgi:hypothetical protein
METNASFVARIVGNLKATSKDSHISRRFILNIGRDKARFLMSQKLDEMTLFREEGIKTYIECFRLESVDYKNCDIFEFRVCKNIMKSVKKLPKGIFGKNGSGIILVTDLGGNIYDFITPKKFLALQDRKYVINSEFYYTIKDGFLILPNSSNEIVELEMFALDKKEAEDVSDCSDKSCCKSAWEYPFVCPDRFLDLVARDTLQEVGSFYRTSIKDENGNLDTNIKSQTTA